MMSSTPTMRAHSLTTAAQAIDALQIVEPADTGSGAFPSLLALRKAHLRLLLRAKDPKQTPKTEEINAFLDRATATGARLDTPDDREAAQFILDNWAARQYTARSPYSSLEGNEPQPQTEMPSRRLAPFDSSSVSETAAAVEAAVATLSKEELEIARRILLRLVRLAPDGESFALEPARTSDLDFGDRAHVDKVLTLLESKGVIVQSPDTPERTFALQFEPLTRVWSRYAKWLERRQHFRAQVGIWDASGRNQATLFEGELLDEAHAYHDLTETERQFLRGSRDLERHRRRKMYYWLAAVIVLCIIAIVGWIRASSKAAKAREEAENVRVASEKLRVANVELAQWNVERTKRQMLANLVGIVQALSRIGAAETLQYRKLNLQRWNNLTKESATLRLEYLEAVARWREAGEEAAAARESVLINELRKVDSQLESIKLDENDVESLKAASRRALELGRSVKNALIQADDKMSTEFLESVRTNSYQLVGRYATQIVDRVELGDIQSAVPFIREFWVLYWGDMGIVEGPLVIAGMAGFGKELNELRSRIDRDLTKPAKEIISKQKDRGTGPFDFFWQTADAAIRQDNSGTVKDALGKVRLEPRQLSELKRARDALLQALEAELKDKLRAEDVSLQAY